MVNGKRLLLVGLIFFSFFAFVLPKEAERFQEFTGTSLSPDTSFLYSPQDLYHMAEEYGPMGRSYYVASRIRFDIIWPVVYLSFFVLFLSGLLRSLPRENPWRLCNLLPFLSFFLDMGENMAAAVVMYRYPRPTAISAALAPVFTFLKWLSLFCSAVILFWGLILLFKRKGGRISSLR